MWRPCSRPRTATTSVTCCRPSSGRTRQPPRSASTTSTGGRGGSRRRSSDRSSGGLPGTGCGRSATRRRGPHHRLADNHHFPKYASSVAHQAGTPWSWTESFSAYVCALTLEEMKWITDFQFVRGINLLISGQALLSTKGHYMGSIRPMFGRENPVSATWTYHAYTARLSYLLSLGRPVILAAILLPGVGHLGRRRGAPPGSRVERRAGPHRRTGRTRPAANGRLIPGTARHDYRRATQLSSRRYQGAHPRRTPAGRAGGECGAGVAVRGRRSSYPGAPGSREWDAKMIWAVPRNLKHMRSFAAAWPDRRIVQQIATQLPWFHNAVLLDKIKDAETVCGTPESSKKAGAA